MAPNRLAGLRRRHTYSWALVMAFAVAGGGALWLGSGIVHQVSALNPPPVAITVSVKTTELEFASKVTVSGEMSTPGPLLWSGATGILTSLEFGVGEVLQTGSAIASVDGRVVRSYAADTALYRPLSIGDTGPDVVIAQRILARVLKLDLADDGRFGMETLRAVRAYEQGLGLTPSGILRPEWFVRLPSEDYRVGKILLQVGQGAPAMGQPIAEAGFHVTSIAVTANSTGPDGRYDFAYQGAYFPVSVTGGEFEWQDREKVASLLEAQSPVDGVVAVQGRLALKDPMRGQGIPAASVIRGSDGTSCVLLRTSAMPVDVTVVASAGDGTALIEPVLPEDAQVVVNPGEVRGGAECR